MMDGTWSGKAGRLEDFIYEVYAVDFSEQGGALHGRFLELQSDFVAQVVQSLAVSRDKSSLYWIYGGNKVILIF